MTKPLTAISFEREFDHLLQRGRKAGIVTSTQYYALADTLHRMIKPKIATEERLAQIKADHAEQRRLAAMSSRQRREAKLLKATDPSSIPWTV